MRNLLLFAISLTLIIAPVNCFAATDDGFAVNQALSLYSATEDGSSIVISEDGISVVERTVTVTFSSEELVSNSSEFTVIAYKPLGEEAQPSKANIYYLNQLVYSSGTITFKIPSEAPIGTYVLLMGASDLNAVARATFGIGIDTDVVVGDVNNDSVFNTLDIIKLKKYIAKDSTVVSRWTDRDTYASDFSKDGFSNVLDVVLMRETIANRVIE